MDVLIAFLIVTITVNSVLRLYDRGSRERVICNRFMQSDLAESFSEAEAAGLGIRDVEYARKRRGTQVRLINVTLAGLYVLLTALFYGVVGVGPLGTAIAVGVVLAAHSAGLSCTFGDTVLKRRGHLDHAESMPSAETPLRLLSLFTIGLIGVGGVWLILSSAAVFETDGFTSIEGFARVLAGVLVLNVAAVPARMIDRYLLSRRRTTRFGFNTSDNEILYLRSFDDDAHRIRWSMTERGPASSATGGGLVRFEELLAAFLKTEGNLVAIGRPGETLPRLGAARTYWSDDDWQEAVRGTAMAARFVVMVAGTSGGLRWEVSHLRQWGLLSKCLFVVPPGTGEETARRIFLLCDELEINPETLDGFPYIATLAFCVSPRGRLVAYVSNGRDWLGYGAVLTAFNGVLEGKIEPPEHGSVARACGYDVAPEPQ